MILFLLLCMQMVFSYAKSLLLTESAFVKSLAVSNGKTLSVIIYPGEVLIIPQH